MKMELRVHGSELRSNEDGTMTVSGYVNKTNQLSEVLGVTKRFVEKISKGAFSQAIQNAQRDIDFLAEHNSKLILASTRNGSLQLNEDEQGLFMSATISPTSWGKDYYQLIDDGILQNMSFGFRTVKDSWRSLDSGLFERTITELELFEVSVVKDPAYSQSTIAARSIEIVDEPEIPEVEEVREVKMERNLPIEIAKQAQLVDQLRTMKKLGINVKESLLKRETQKLEELQEEQRMISKLEKKVKELEERTLNTSSITATQGQAVSPIVSKLESISNAYAKARKIPFTGEQLKVPYETALEDAQFVSEGSNVPEINLNIAGFAVLGKKRCGVSASMTNQVIISSGVDFKDYVQDFLIERVGRSLEKAILTGSGVDSFKGIAGDAGVISSTVTLANPTIDQLRRIYLNVHEDVLSTSEWYMSRPFFEKVAQLKDANGEYYVTDDCDNDDPLNRPELFGYPINISSALAVGDTIGQVSVIFGSIESAYTIGISKDIEVKLVIGMNQALGGYSTMLAEIFCDGAVTNYSAVAKGTIA